MTSAPNILLVDDEPSVLRYTKTLLEIDNYHVETAGSGEEALQRMLMHGPRFQIQLSWAATPLSKKKRTAWAVRKYAHIERSLSQTR